MRQNIFVMWFLMKQCRSQYNSSDYLSSYSYIGVVIINLDLPSECHTNSKHRTLNFNQYRESHSHVGCEDYKAEIYNADIG